MAKRKVPSKNNYSVNRARNVRRAAAELKRLGLAYGKKDLRSARVTDYMRRRVKQLLPALTGEAEIVRGTPREIRAVRSDPGLVARGRDFVLVPKERGAVQTIRQGMRSIVRPLDDGTTIEKLVVPGGASIHNVLRWLETPSADRAKLKREWFAFRFEEHASARVFPDAKSLYEFLALYVENEEGDGPAPKVHLYRVYPPGDWYELVKREAQDRIGELTMFEKSAKGKNARRIKKAIEGMQAKLRIIPRHSSTRNERREKFLEGERKRNRKRQSGEDYKRYKREQMRAKRGTKKPRKE